MEEARMIELLVELHEGLDRLGPGDTQSTLRALRLCSELPPKPNILDAGCGTGAQTLTLAKNTEGTITATDLMPSFLSTATERVAASGLQSRVTTQVADMGSLPFAEGEFDLIWSEGAIYIIGFDTGLAAWRRFLKPGGYLVVSEASWFQPSPPEELADYWAEGYPGMRRAEANADAAQAEGWEVVATFNLPDLAWTGGYYAPLRERLEEFRRRHAGDEEALGVAAMTDREMELFDAYSDYYGYAFYVLRRDQE
jgi:ubiquinone/menaquinone biosynthesis C-methylase UbiE